MGPKYEKLSVGQSGITFIFAFTDKRSMLDKKDEMSVPGLSVKLSGGEHF